MHNLDNCTRQGGGLDLESLLVPDVEPQFPHPENGLMKSAVAQGYKECSRSSIKCLLLWQALFQVEGTGDQKPGATVGGWIWSHGGGKGGGLSQTSVSRGGGQSRHGGHCGPPRPAEPQCPVPGAAEGAGALRTAHLPAPPAPGGHHRCGPLSLRVSICLLVPQSFTYLSWFSPCARSDIMVHEPALWAKPFSCFIYILISFHFSLPLPLGILQYLVHFFIFSILSDD